MDYSLGEKSKIKMIGAQSSLKCIDLHIAIVENTLIRW